MATAHEKESLSAEEAQMLHLFRSSKKQYGKVDELSAMQAKFARQLEMTKKHLEHTELSDEPDEEKRGLFLSMIAQFDNMECIIRGCLEQLEAMQVPAGMLSDSRPIAEVDQVILSAGEYGKTLHNLWQVYINILGTTIPLINFDSVKADVMARLAGAEGERDERLVRKRRRVVGCTCRVHGGCKAYRCPCFKSGIACGNECECKGRPVACANVYNVGASASVMDCDDDDDDE